MHICYVDESGTPDIDNIGNTTHFVLAGISLPIEFWRDADKEITKIKKEYGFADENEIHTAWLNRKYIEQKFISNFDNLNHTNRRKEVRTARKSNLYKLQKNQNRTYGRTKKDYKKTDPYIHLTHKERKEFVEKIAESVAKWSDVRLFADCIDKTFFDPQKAGHSVGEEAFDQLISRFNTFLENKSRSPNSNQKNLGIIVHDNNVEVAGERMKMMRNFFSTGTKYRKDIDNVIETPLFVDSNLTSMVQIADLCAYALRRYIENRERNLFDRIFRRADRKNNKLVGIRHFTDPNLKCDCDLCST